MKIANLSAVAAIALAACANTAPAQFDGLDGTPTVTERRAFMRDAAPTVTACTRELRALLPNLSDALALDQCNCIAGYLADSGTRHELQAIVRFQVNGDRSYADANNAALSRMEAGSRQACPAERLTRRSPGTVLN